MKVNDLIRDLIMKQSNADQIRECAFEKNGRSLLTYGMNLVKTNLLQLKKLNEFAYSMTLNLKNYEINNLMSELVKRNGSDLHLTETAILFLGFKDKFYQHQASNIQVKN